MLMTEKEAVSTICPHLPVDVQVEQADYAQIHRVIKFANCWGAKCSQWRWKMEPIHGDAGALRGWRQTDKGYCGLAGVPVQS